MCLLTYYIIFFAKVKGSCKKNQTKNSVAIATEFGAGNQNRTDDLVITNDVLYRLSHTSVPFDYDIITNRECFVKGFFEKNLKKEKSIEKTVRIRPVARKKVDKRVNIFYNK